MKHSFTISVIFILLAIIFLPFNYAHEFSCDNEMRHKDKYYDNSGIKSGDTESTRETISDPGGISDPGTNNDDSTEIERVLYP